MLTVYRFEIEADSRAKIELGASGRTGVYKHLGLYNDMDDLLEEKLIRCGALDIGEFTTYFDRQQAKNQFHPVPLRIRAYINRFMVTTNKHDDTTYHSRYAFPNLQALDRWFDKDFRELFAWHGAVLCVYEVPEEHAIGDYVETTKVDLRKRQKYFGADLQLAFDIRHATLVKEFSPLDVESMLEC